jgi:hypothetical protein
MNVTIGQHVRLKHKGRRQWGVVKRLIHGVPEAPFPENWDMAEVEWTPLASGYSPFPVAFADLLENDDDGVVAGILNAQRFREDAEHV